MKNLRFLLIAVVLTCFVCIAQTNAQVLANEKGTEYKPLVYEVDGVQYLAAAFLEYHLVVTPSGKLTWISHGYLTTDYGPWLYIGWPETLEEQPLAEIPLPKSNVKAYDPQGFDEKVTITPTGRVTVVAHNTLW